MEGEGVNMIFVLARLLLSRVGDQALAVANLEAILKVR